VGARSTPSQERARGNEINTAAIRNRLRAWGVVVFRIVNQKYRIELGKAGNALEQANSETNWAVKAS
jgi:hypothetical protein